MHIHCDCGCEVFTVDACEAKTVVFLVCDSCGHEVTIQAVLEVKAVDPEGAE